MSGKSKDSLPEDCVCPICSDVYVGHVFQCVNGHAVCARCVKPLSACPQCRISYNGAPIRVRALENMLDRMSFDCKFKEDGCSLKLKRAEFSAHLKTCEHGGIDLCHILGLLCNNKTNTQNIQKALGHLMRDHRIKTEGHLSRFTVQINMLPGNHCWNPVMFDTSDPNSRVIVSFVTCSSLGSTSLKVLGVRLRLYPDIAVQNVQLQFKFIVQNKAIVRTQKVDNVENCGYWTFSLLVEFREQIAKHIILEGLTVDCTVLVDNKFVEQYVFDRPLKLNEVRVILTPVKNDSMQERPSHNELVRQYERKNWDQLVGSRQVVSGQASQQQTDNTAAQKRHLKKCIPNRI